MPRILISSWKEQTLVSIKLKNIVPRTEYRFQSVKIIWRWYYNADSNINEAWKLNTKTYLTVKVL